MDSQETFGVTLLAGDKNNPLILDYVGIENKIRYWKVRVDQKIWVNGKDYLVPAGYKTDLASIPWWAWALIGKPTDAEFIEAAVLHDWFCDEAKRLNCLETRCLGDALFRFKLKESGVSPRRRRYMYLAVRYQGFRTIKGIPVLKRTRQYTFLKD